METVNVTTPGTGRGRDDRYVLLATGLLMSCVVGTNAGLHGTREMASGKASITAGHAFAFAPLWMTAAQEVTTARDQLARCGLARHQIARALGVDRRSLSGWATGDIRPTAERLAALHALVEVTVAIDAAHPGRAAEILTHRRGGADLLDQLARGRVDVLRTWEQWVLRRSSRVTVTPRRVDVEPLWAAAARAMAAGRLQPLERTPTVREESEYEMDLEEAAGFKEPSQDEPRRRSYE